MKLVVNDSIHLSEVRPSDKAAYLEHLQEKEIYDQTLRIPYPYTAADFDAFLERAETKSREQGRPVVWGIRRQDDYLIGACGLGEAELGKPHLAEIGYWLAKPYWGRKIMTAVVRRTCEFAFTELGLAKLTALVWSENAASARVLEKCGFEQEGYLKKHFVKAGELRDSRLFGLLGPAVGDHWPAH
jgi:RimJ/RimL family protein N-acetyltransferase